MSGNKAVYTEAIKKGHNAAWDGNWKKAIAEYQRAISELPQDVTAHQSLAHVLEEDGQLERALEECRIASKLQPNDAQPLVRIANLQERLGQLGEAAGTYLAVADIYVGQKAIGKAVEMWQRAAALEPDRTDVHQRLAAAYESAGHRSLAGKEYVALARVFLKHGDKEKAHSQAQKALGLDPHSSAAKAFLEQLAYREQDSPAAASPVGKAQEQALSKLAGTLLDEQPRRADSGLAPEKSGSASGTRLSQAQVDSLIARAVDAQTQHRIGDAIQCYSELLAAGVSRPEVKFTLGMLYFETARYEQAILLLQETANDPSYSLASHFTLGRCFRAQGNLDAAVEHFLQATKIVDLGSVPREQADELISAYEDLAESFAAKGDREQAESFSRSLEELLSKRGWEDKVREVRHHLELLRATGSQVSLAEMIKVPDSGMVLEALGLAEEHYRAGKLNAASEECLRAIELAPLYIPAHVRLAEVLAKAERVDEACIKFRTLAELAAARRDLARAEGFYRRQIELKPSDIEGRTRLVDVMVQQGHGVAALDEYLELGDVHLQAGRLEKAAEVFTKGTQLAARVNGAAAGLELRHRLADTLVKQGNTQAALEAYQAIGTLYPDDERAHIGAVDLLVEQGQLNAAEHELDALLDAYRQRNQPEKAIGVLEALVQHHSDALVLRARLAHWYGHVGDRERLLDALDELGELQINAGQKQAAAETIRQIISLDPPRVEEYKQLLQQIAE